MSPNATGPHRSNPEPLSGRRMDLLDGPVRVDVHVCADSVSGIDPQGEAPTRTTFDDQTRVPRVSDVEGLGRVVPGSADPRARFDCASGPLRFGQLTFKFDDALLGIVFLHQQMVPPGCCGRSAIWAGPSGQTADNRTRPLLRTGFGSRGARVRARDERPDPYPCALSRATTCRGPNCRAGNYRAQRCRRSRTSAPTNRAPSCRRSMRG